MSEIHVLVRAIESYFKERELLTGFRAMQRAYFEEYSDAIGFDATFDAALRVLWDVCFPNGISQDKDFDQFFGLSEED